MKTKKYIFSLIFKLPILILGILGSYNTFSERIPALGGDGRPVALFFTSWTAWICTLSVLISIILTILVLTKKVKNVYNKWFIVIKLSADTMAIVTFLIAAFVLPDRIWLRSYWTYGWTIKHFLLPILTVADTFLFFDGKITWWQPICASIPMLMYGIYMIPRLLIFRAKSGGHIPETEWQNYYPYAFTNIDKNGGSPLLFFALILGLAVLMIGLSYIYYLILKKRNKK